MSRLARRRSSTSKQTGAAMSSRLMPPKTGAMRSTVSTISSAPLTLRHTGNASTPANSLKSRALPSITGSAASGPMLPRPSTAVPSVTMATVFFLIVRSWARARSLAISLQTRATPGVYAIDRSSLSPTGSRGSTSILPPSCSSKVRSTHSMTSTPSRPSMWRRTSSWCASSRQLTLMFSSRIGPFASNPPRPAMLPPASPIATARRPSEPGTLSRRTRMRTE